MPVRQMEGVKPGCLVQRNLDEAALAHGEIKHIWKGNNNPVMDDLQFRFKQGVA